MVIDADAHANEPRDLFDRYLEKDFRDNGPKVVEIGNVLYWMVEGKLFPRLWETMGMDPQRLPLSERQTGHGDQRPGTR